MSSHSHVEPWKDSSRKGVPGKVPYPCGWWCASGLGVNWHEGWRIGGRQAGWTLQTSHPRAWHGGRRAEYWLAGPKTGPFGLVTVVDDLLDSIYSFWKRGKSIPSNPTSDVIFMLHLTIINNSTRQFLKFCRSSLYLGISIFFPNLWVQTYVTSISYIYLLSTLSWFGPWTHRYNGLSPLVKYKTNDPLLFLQAS